jgi:hypothetical protein
MTSPTRPAAAATRARTSLKISGATCSRRSQARAASFIDERPSQFRLSEAQAKSFCRAVASLGPAPASSCLKKT